MKNIKIYLFALTCLPAGVELTTVVTADFNAATSKVTKVELKDELQKVGAKCNGKKLVTKDNRPIVFYRLRYERKCLAAVPSDIEEVRKKQDDEIRTLSVNNEVITLTCNPTGIAVP